VARRADRALTGTPGEAQAKGVTVHPSPAASVTTTRSSAGCTWDRIESISRDIATLSTRIEQVMAPFRERLTRLDAIPGISLRVAEVIIAETGGDMSLDTLLPGRASLGKFRRGTAGLGRAGEVPPKPPSCPNVHDAHMREIEAFRRIALGKPW
jgi:hypothetical protein